MQQEASGGNKKKRIGYLLGYTAAILLPGIIVYLALSLLHQRQEELPLDQQRTGTSVRESEVITNRVITANSHRDFGAVCGGFTVRNSDTYSGKSSALIVTFSQSPRTKDSWSYEDVGYGKTYTKTEGDFTKINTVACLHEILDTKVFSKMCDYNQAGEKVSVRYYSIRYKLSYYEAKTGERIADGGHIEAPAGECPGFVAYDEQSLTAYAAPANEAIDIAHSKFISQ